MQKSVLCDHCIVKFSYIYRLVLAIFNMEGYASPLEHFSEVRRGRVGLYQQSNPHPNWICDLFNIFWPLEASICKIGKKISEDEITHPVPIIDEETFVSVHRHKRSIFDMNLRDPKESPENMNSLVPIVDETTLVEALQAALKEVDLKNNERSRSIRAAESPQKIYNRRAKQFQSRSGLLLNWSAGLNFNVFKRRKSSNDNVSNYT